MAQISKTIYFGQVLATNDPEVVFSHPAAVLTSAGFGQVTVWQEKDHTLAPKAVLFPSATQSSGRLVALCEVHYSLDLDLVSQRQMRSRLATLHQDLKLRIWDLAECVCIALLEPRSEFASVTGMVELEPGRLVLAGQEAVLLFDVASSKVIFKLSLNFDQPLASVVAEQSVKIILKFGIRQQQIIVKTEPASLFLGPCLMNYDVERAKEDPSLQRIKQFYAAQRSVKKTFYGLKLLEKDFLMKYYRTLKPLMQEQISCSSLSFLQSSLYYFFGLKSGKLVGLPCLHEPHSKSLFIFSKEIDSSSIAYLRFFDSLLVASTQSGRLLVFDFSNSKALLKAIVSEGKEIETFLVNIDKLLVLQQLQSRPVIYSLRVLNCRDDKQICLVLANKELVVLDLGKRQSTTLAVRQAEAHIYCIAILEHQRFAVCTSKSVQITGKHGLIRTIGYDKFPWERYIKNGEQGLTWPDQHDQHLSWLIRKINYTQAAINRKYDRLRRELWGRPAQLKEGGKLAAREGHFNIHVHNLFVSASKKVLGVVLQVRLNNKRGQHWDNTGYLVDFDTRSFCRNVHQRQLVTPCFLHYSEFKRYSKQASQSWNQVFRTKTAFKGIGNSFVVFLSKSSCGRVSTSLQILNYVNLYRNVVGVDQDKSINQLLQLCRRLHSENGSIAAVANPFIWAGLAVSQSSTVTQCALNLIASYGSLTQFSDLEGIAFIQEQGLGLKNVASRVVQTYHCLSKPRQLDILHFINSCSNIHNGSAHPNELCLLLKLLKQHLPFLVRHQPFPTAWGNIIANLFSLFFQLQYSEEVQPYLLDPLLKPYSGIVAALSIQEDTRNRLKHLLSKAACQVMGQSMKDTLQLLTNSFQPNVIHPLYPSCILKLVEKFLKYKDAVLGPHILVLTSILMRCLDPAYPSLRKWSALPATRVLALLAQRSDVAMCEQHYKLAVYSAGQVSLFELRSGSKWNTLQTKQLRVMSFSNSGKFLAGYCPSSNEVTVWKVGGPGLFAGLRWLQGSQMQTLKVERSLVDQTRSELRWKSDDKEVTLLCGNDIINFRL